MLWAATTKKAKLLVICLFPLKYIPHSKIAASRSSHQPVTNLFLLRSPSSIQQGVSGGTISKGLGRTDISDLTSQAGDAALTRPLHGADREAACVHLPAAVLSTAAFLAVTLVTSWLPSVWHGRRHHILPQRGTKRRRRWLGTIGERAGTRQT